MPSIFDVKRRIEDANALGRQNLADKGVVVAENATTNETFQEIKKCSPKLENTVAFVSEGETYEVVSVKDGNSINAPATEPISESGTFVGWQNNGTNVNFPFEPLENTTLTANFKNVRTEMEISSKVNLWYKGASGSAFDASSKTNTDTALIASVSSYNGNSTKKMGVLVGLTEKSVEITCRNNGYTIRTIDYNGTTYYFNCCNTQCSSFNQDLTILDVGTFNCNTDYSYTEEQLTQIAKAILDYYFYIN